VKLGFCTAAFRGQAGVLHGSIPWSSWGSARQHSVIKLGFCTAAFRGQAGVLHGSIPCQTTFICKSMQETIITNSPPSPPADLRALTYSITVTQMPQLNGRGESVVGARLMRPGGTELLVRAGTESATNE
jgi:hypothetical protein